MWRPAVLPTEPSPEWLQPQAQCSHMFVCARLVMVGGLTMSVTSSPAAKRVSGPSKWKKVITRTITLFLQYYFKGGRKVDHISQSALFTDIDNTLVINCVLAAPLCKALPIVHTLPKYKPSKSGSKLESAKIPRHSRKSVLNAYLILHARRMLSRPNAWG